MGSLSQFEENVGPLRRGHLSAGEGIRGIGFFEGVKNADYFLHSFILLWFRLDFPFWFRYLSIPAPQFTPAAFSPRARCMRSSQCENASAAVRRNWESPLETIRRLGTRLGFFQKPGGPANLPPALDPLSLSVEARALGNFGPARFQRINHVENPLRRLGARIYSKRNPISKEGWGFGRSEHNGDKDLMRIRPNLGQGGLPLRS